MKFLRGFAIASLISASLPLAVACGSANNSDLFSPSAGAGRSSSGGASAGSTAGVSAAGGAEDGDNGGSSTNTGGALNGGDTGDSGGAATAGAATAGAGTEPGGAGGAQAGAGGAVTGAGAGGSLAGAGGATAGAGGTAGASAGAGGMSGGAGAAGTGCTPMAPKADQVCTVSTPDSCFYAGEACSCLPGGNSGGGAQFKHWGCYGTPDLCPDAKPSAGLSCKQSIGAECPYSASEYCVCMGNNNDPHWVCQAPGAFCSAQKPQSGDNCGGTLRTCTYADVACFCNGTKWSCEGA